MVIFLHFAWFVKILDFALPVFKTKNTTVSFKVDDVNQALRCEVENEPKSTIEWQRNGKKVEDLPAMSFQNSMILFFTKISKSHEGKYTCLATSTSGKLELDFQLTVGADKPEDKNGILLSC